MGEAQPWTVNAQGVLRTETVGQGTPSRGQRPAPQQELAHLVLGAPVFVSVVTFLTVGDFCHFPLLIQDLNLRPQPQPQDLNPNLGCSGTPIWWGDPKPSGRLSLPVVAVGF